MRLVKIIVGFEIFSDFLLSRLKKQTETQVQISRTKDGLSETFPPQDRTCQKPELPRKPQQPAEQVQKENFGWVRSVVVNQLVFPPTHSLAAELLEKPEPGF